MAFRSVACGRDSETAAGRRLSLGIALASRAIRRFVSERGPRHSVVAGGSESQRPALGEGHLEKLSTWFGALARSVRDRTLGWLRSPSTWRWPPLSLLVLVTALCAVLGVACVGAPPAPCHSVVERSACCRTRWPGEPSSRRAALRELLRLPACYPQIGFYHGIASGKLHRRG